MKRFDASAVDLLYVLTDDGDRYVIPSSVITATRGLGLGQKWEPDRVQPESLKLRPMGD